MDTHAYATDHDYVTVQMKTVVRCTIVGRCSCMLVHLGAVLQLFGIILSHYLKPPPSTLTYLVKLSLTFKGGKII
jgi:hypothetical protein